MQKHVSGELFLHPRSLDDNPSPHDCSRQRLILTVPWDMTYCTMVRTPDTSTAYFGTDKDRFPAKLRDGVLCVESSRTGRCGRSELSAAENSIYRLVLLALRLSVRSA